MKTYVMAGSKKPSSPIRSSEMFGYSSVEIIGRKMIEFFIEEKRNDQVDCSLEEWFCHRVPTKFYEFDIDSGSSAKNVSKINMWRLICKEPTLHSLVAQAMLLK